MNFTEKSRITITWGEVAIVAINMGELGKKAENGFVHQELRVFGDNAVREGFSGELYYINQILSEPFFSESKPAAVLVIRNGINWLLRKAGYTANDMLSEQLKLVPDKKYFEKRAKKVLNLRARDKCRFGDEDEKPNYEENIGTTYDIKKLPVMNAMRHALETKFGEKAHLLNAEGNYYEDITKENGINPHCDNERKIVIANSLGASTILSYQYFFKKKPVSERLDLQINGGDLYIMCENARGVKSRTMPVLKHSAGGPKYRIAK